jgi:hypothetical protein
MCVLIRVKEQLMQATKLNHRIGNKRGNAKPGDEIETQQTGSIRHQEMTE